MIYTTHSEIVSAVFDAYNKAPISPAERLYSCKAWVFELSNSDFVVLQSYSTIVAAFQRSTGILWVFGFYSNTTAMHIAKFCTWIRYTYKTGCNYPRKVNLYNDSRTGKRAARKNLDDDFASVITTAVNQH